MDVTAAVISLLASSPSGKSTALVETEDSEFTDEAQIYTR